MSTMPMTGDFMLDPEEEKMIEKADKEAKTFKKIEEKFKDTV